MSCRLQAIAVCGSGAVAPGEPSWAFAEELGRRIVAVIGARDR